MVSFLAEEGFIHDEWFALAEGRKLDRKTLMWVFAIVDPFALWTEVSVGGSQ
jgi:hypothetical protein